MMGAIAFLGSAGLLNAPSVDEMRRREKAKLDDMRDEINARERERERQQIKTERSARMPHQGKKEMARRLKRMKASMTRDNA